MALRVLSRRAARVVSAASRPTAPTVVALSASPSFFLDPVAIATRYQTRSFAKAKKKKDSKGRANVPTAVLADKDEDEDNEEEEDGVVDDEEDGGAAKAVRKATKNMKGAVVNFTRTLRQMRPGRADAGVFDELHVQAYDQHVPMAQVAQVSVVSSHALSVSVYDPSLLQDVKKAIESTNPVYSVREDASGLEISFPKMSKETRAELLKATKKQAEKARQHVRRVRQDAMNHAKKLKETVSEDAMEAQKERIQKVTDGAIAEIAKILEAKETDLSTV